MIVYGSPGSLFSLSAALLGSKHLSTEFTEKVAPCGVLQAFSPAVSVCACVPFAVPALTGGGCQCVEGYAPAYPPTMPGDGGGGGGGDGASLALGCEPAPPARAGAAGGLGVSGTVAVAVLVPLACLVAVAALVAFQIQARALAAASDGAAQEEQASLLIPVHQLRLIQRASVMLGSLLSEEEEAEDEEISALTTEESTGKSGNRTPRAPAPRLVDLTFDDAIVVRLEGNDRPIIEP